MSRDPMTAAKADLEERDRIKALASDARAILNRLEDDPVHPEAYLMAHGYFSWGEARAALEYIAWEDKHISAFDRRMNEYRARTPGQKDPDR